MVRSTNYFPPDQACLKWLLTCIFAPTFVAERAPMTSVDTKEKELVCAFDNGRSRASGGGVVCSGVELTTLELPASFAVCQERGLCAVQVNAKALLAFQLAVERIDYEGLGSTITEFGTVNQRLCRSGSTGQSIPGCVSKHSYGTAADFRAFVDNANWEAVVSSQPNVLRTVAVFEQHGFYWGANFENNFDPQHVEWVRE